MTASKATQNFTVIVLVAVIASAGLYVWTGIGPGDGWVAGYRMPAMNAVGWINGKAPTSNELTGKVVVVNAWATWCNKCTAEMPGLIKVHQKYRDRNVVFIGLTAESGDARSLRFIEKYVANKNIEWLIGYGAIAPLTDLEAEYIPQTWVFDREGNVIWTKVGAPDELGKAIDRALEP